MAVTGIVDENIHGAVIFFSLFDDHGYAIEIGDIAEYGVNARQLRGEACSRCFGPDGADDGVACGAGGGCNSETETRIGSGDEKCPVAHGMRPRLIVDLANNMVRS
ncbi:hypothetical protein D3C87_1878660 [compost metagenome]